MGSPGTKRNGSTPKTVRTPFGRSTSARLATASVRSSPRWCPKHSRTIKRLNEQIIAMYGRGMTVREISAYLEEPYDIESARVHQQRYGERARGRE